MCKLNYYTKYNYKFNLTTLLKLITKNYNYSINHSTQESIGINEGSQFREQISINDAGKREKQSDHRQQYIK